MSALRLLRVLSVLGKHASFRWNQNRAHPCALVRGFLFAGWWLLNVRDLLYLFFGAILGVGIAVAVGILPGLIQWVRAATKPAATKLADQNQVPPM